VKALPVKHRNAKTDEVTKRKRRKQKSHKDDDDTPRAFKQLMQLQKTGKGLKGLDDGRVQAAAGQKRKRNGEVQDASKDEEPTAEQTASELKIKPGERLTDYAARVDQALPVSGLIAKHNKVEGQREQRKTKHEKKLQRLVNNWKAEEAKRIEKAQEDWDEEDEEEDENAALWEAHAPAYGGGKGKNKAKKGGKGDDDPWAELKKKRDKPKGIFDVVQAPPQFSKVPKEFKIKDGARVDVNNVPNSGSLRRQEMLSETRKDVIARYRAMMQEKRGEA
jgi:hypothetical protein